MSKLEKQNVLQCMFTELIYFFIILTISNISILIFFIFIIPVCYQKEYQFNCIYVVEPPVVPLLIIICLLYEDILCTIFKNAGEKSNVSTYDNKN
jgi:hypothetical protein